MDQRAGRRGADALRTDRVGLELMIFESRRLLAPIYVGIVLSVLLLLVKFVQ